MVSIGFGTRYQLTKETTDASGQPVVMHLSQMDRPMVFILVFLTIAAIIGIGISFLGLAYHHHRRHHEFCGTPAQRTPISVSRYRITTIAYDLESRGMFPRRPTTRLSSHLEGASHEFLSFYLGGRPGSWPHRHRRRRHRHSQEAGREMGSHQERRLASGATLEFTEDGKLHMRAKVKDKEFKMDGTYKVKDNVVIATYTVNGKTKSEPGKITKLTEKVLVIEDEKGKLDEYKRVK